MTNLKKKEVFLKHIYHNRVHSVTPDILLVVNEFWSYSGMSAVTRAVKRRQKRDFLIAMTKFCGLFGVLEIYVSWVCEGMATFIFDDDDDDYHHRQHHHFLSRMRYLFLTFRSSRITVSLWLLY